MLEFLARLFVRPGESKGRVRRRVAVVVPLSSRLEFLPEEQVSLRHLCHFLGPYDKYLVAPRGSRIQLSGFETMQVPRKFFGSVTAHNQLLMWPRFYRAFSDYEYILVYHLDSLVFSDELLRWCGAGWDYIGAPWLPCADTPWVTEARVGNGGFTLMKVDSILRVLANRHRQKPVSYWADLLTRNDTVTWPLMALLEQLHRLLPRWEMLGRAVSYWRIVREAALNHYSNDVFWSYEAERYLPSFKVAPVDEGLRFAFEAAPRLCFEMNRQQLPFGCHAWPKFDRTFWEPHLLAAREEQFSAST